MNEDKQKIENYIREIEHVPSLSEEETRQLILSRATILQKVVQAYLQLVVSVTKEYMGQNGNQFDLILKGNMALVRAVETFEATDPEPFSVYAIRSIRAVIEQDQKDNS